MPQDWDQISQNDQKGHTTETYVTLIEGASLGGGKTSSCCFVVDENPLLPGEELCGRRRQ